jgi:hypothetical protein
MRSTWILLAAVTFFASTAAADPGDVLRTFGVPVEAPHHATYPLGLASDGPRLFVANIEEASNPSSPFAIFVLSADDGSLLDRIDYNSINQTLKDMAFVGPELWALNADRKRRIIHPDSGTNMEGYATLTIRMRGMAFDPGCDAMWEIVEETGQLGQLDTLVDPQPSTTIELRSLPGGEVLHSTNTVSEHSFWYSLAYDGCSLWTVDRDNLELVRIDVNDGAELARLPTPSDKPIGLAYRQGELLLSDNGTDLIYAIEIGPTAGCIPTQAPTVCHVPGIVPETSPPEPGTGGAGGATTAPPPDDDGESSGASSSDEGGCGIATGTIPPYTPACWLALAAFGLRRLRRQHRA